MNVLELLLSGGGLPRAEILENLSRCLGRLWNAAAYAQVRHATLCSVVVVASHAKSDFRT
jgi:hypothetical protein